MFSVVYVYLSVHMDVPVQGPGLGPYRTLVPHPPAQDPIPSVRGHGPGPLDMLKLV